MLYTELMVKLFSDATPEEFKKKVAEKIDEAAKEGSAELKDGDVDLKLKNEDGKIVIEDKKNNEKTVAKDDGKEYKLEAKTESDTQPDVKVEKPKGEGTEAPEKPDSTVDDVTVCIKPAIEDKEKAGVDKHYSISFDGFKSQNDAEKFLSQTLTFSETELEEIKDKANELKELAERVEGTKNKDLAVELKDKAESIKAYSILASNRGLDMTDLIEACEYFSNYADETLTEIVSEMPVTEYFSDMSEDAINAYFSNLDEVEANVIYSIIEDQDNVSTFSDAEDIVNSVYSEIELSTPVNEIFSEMDEDELNAFFSELDPETANVVYSMIEEDENVTFSDINEVLETNNTELIEMFSDMSEDELREFSETVGEDVANIAFSLAMDEDKNYTFSDLQDLLEYVNSFSEEDIEEIKKNAEEIKKAADKMEETKDADLAKKVKILAEAVKEDAEKAEEQGHDTKEVKEACEKYSLSADEVMIHNQVNPSTVNYSEVELFSDAESTKEEPKEEPKAFADVTFEAVDTNNDGIVTVQDWTAAGLNQEDFVKVDTNADGKVTKEEFEAFKANAAQPAQPAVPAAPAEPQAPSQPAAPAAPAAPTQSNFSDYLNAGKGTRVFADLNPSNNSEKLDSCFTFKF